MRSLLPKDTLLRTYLPLFTIITSGRRQSKTPILSRKIDQKSIETEFLIVICRPTGDKWQLKTLFLSLFDPRSSIVDNVLHCRLSSVINKISAMGVQVHVDPLEYTFE